MLNQNCSVEALAQRNKNIVPGIYIFNGDDYDTVEEAIEDGAGRKIETYYQITTKNQLLQLMLNGETIVNAIGNDSWIVVFCDSKYQLQAAEINTLDDEEINDFLQHTNEAIGLCSSSADHVTDLFVLDPDTKQPVEISIYKDRESGGMFGVDGAYLVTLSDDDTVSNPFNGRDMHLIESSPLSPSSQVVDIAKGEQTLSIVLINSQHGFDDYDVEGNDAGIRRICVPHSIKKGDNFNVYFGSSSKAGATWLGNIEDSLEAFIKNTDLSERDATAE